MGIDPELLKQLIDTFKSELFEQTQIMTHALLELEKKNKSIDEINKVIETIFRCAHNIKGASRSLGIDNIDKISHKLESLFSNFKNTTQNIPVNIIDLCLEAVDRMNSAMHSFVMHEPLSFDISDLINRLCNSASKSETKNSIEIINEPQVSVATSNDKAIKSDSIRVTVSQIDRISALMEEMQVNKIAIDDHYADLIKLHNQSLKLDNSWQKISNLFKSSTKPSDENLLNTFNSCNDDIYEMKININNIFKNIRGRLNEFSVLSNALQEEIRMLRLIPAAHLFTTFERYVRDISHNMNKEIELKITGDEIKIDKLVLDGIKDPIIHILRNAIDHGIEDAQTRKTLGKSPVGHINIKLVEDKNQVLIYISDDGAGIDENKIKNVILTKNLITSSELEKLSREELFNYIFRPSFSTKDIITDISGRGVGLNVVKTNLESLKGNVTITTELNKGTTFCISVPFTISSERGLVIKCGGEKFVIPISHITKILAMKPTEIIEVQGSQAVLLDDHPIALHALADVLGLTKKSMVVNNRLPVVVIKKNWQEIGFLVDEVIGEREIVIKPLQYPLTNVRCVAGGTLSGSSQIMIVLNAGDLIEQSPNVDKSAPISFNTETVSTPAHPHILVVDDSITTRTLEKHVLESKNYQVTVAVNGKEAWDLIQKHKFSLLITDVTMPFMDGFTLTEHVKKNQNTNYLPVIIVTSLGSEEEKKRGIEVGADAYIVKNEFESGALLEIVSQLV